MTGPRKIFIDGEWRMTGDRAAVRNPFDGSVVAEMYQATAAELEEAVAAAAKAFERGSKLQSFEREAMLLGIAAGIDTRREEFARSIVAEAGKPITFARGEVARAINTFRIAAEESKRLPGEMLSLLLRAEKRGFGPHQLFVDKLWRVAGLGPDGLFEMDQHRVPIVLRFSLETSEESSTTRTTACYMG
ncbi:MAG: aldehyde dehydrogenase family protein, partial [Candidatus Wallbacteria bacterium]|nr:aldehyde dehydrogenase family protein [Candidatus Wallbacteria bacterium]